MMVKWISAPDEEFMQQRLTWIDGLRPFTNVSQQGVIIFSAAEREYEWSDRMLTRHTLQIHMDAYGEHVYTEKFPFGTHIRDVKVKAEGLLTKFRAEGHEIISD